MLLKILYNYLNDFYINKGTSRVEIKTLTWMRLADQKESIIKELKKTPYSINYSTHHVNIDPI